MSTEVLGRSGRFSELRQLLEAAEYSEAAICRRLGLRRFNDFEMDREKRGPLPEPSEAVDLLIRVFLAGDYASGSMLERFLGSGSADLLEGMGLLGRGPGDQYYGLVALYPVNSLYIVSDRWNNPDGSRIEVPADTVYPALVPNTRLFLDLLPWTPCESFLDLCAGTGIAALMAARRGAARAYAGDIAERSSRFAEFNRLLNEVPNVSAVTSDLYENLGGQTFDRIVAHPPYVPTLAPKWIFFSGGEDGEQVTRRIVEGLPSHLRDGGTFCCLTMGSDRKGKPFESRVRGWLGDAERRFDVALVVRRLIDPEHFALQANPLEVRGAEEIRAWRKLFSRLELESLVYGFVVIRRRDAARKTFTVRRQADANTGRAEWEWLFEWETAAAGENLCRLILDSPLHASRGTEFQVVHKLAEGGWMPQSYKLQADWPFRMECQAQPWMAHVISLCDGASTGRQIFRILKENGAVAPDTSDEEFAEGVAVLVSGGFVEVEGFRPPRAAG